MVANAEAQARYMSREQSADPEGWALRRAEATKRWRQDNAEKRAAHHKVYRAVRSGRLVRADSCEHCHKTCKTEAAHTDYSKPLGVLWLCRKCHAVLDMGKQPMIETLESKAV